MFNLSRLHNNRGERFHTPILAPEMALDKESANLVCIASS